MTRKNSISKSNPKKHDPITPSSLLSFKKSPIGFLSFKNLQPREGRDSTDHHAESEREEALLNVNIDSIVRKNRQMKEDLDVVYLKKKAEVEVEREEREKSLKALEWRTKSRMKVSKIYVNEPEEEEEAEVDNVSLKNAEIGSPQKSTRFKIKISSQIGDDEVSEKSETKPLSISKLGSNNTSIAKFSDRIVKRPKKVVVV